MSSSSSSRHFCPSLYVSFNNMFYKAVSTKDVANPVIAFVLLYEACFFPPFSFWTRLIQVTCLVLLEPILQNIQDISDLHSEVCMKLYFSRNWQSMKCLPKQKEKTCKKTVGVDVKASSSTASDIFWFLLHLFVMFAFTTLSITQIMQRQRH